MGLAVTEAILTSLCWQVLGSVEHGDSGELCPFLALQGRMTVMLVCVLIQNVADCKFVHKQRLDPKIILDNHIAEFSVLLAVMIKIQWLLRVVDAEELKSF